MDNDFKIDAVVNSLLNSFALTFIPNDAMGKWQLIGVKSCEFGTCRACEFCQEPSLN